MIMRSLWDIVTNGQWPTWFEGGWDASQLAVGAAIACFFFPVEIPQKTPVQPIIHVYIYIYTYIYLYISK